ncbi:serine/threonine-protein kinase pim-1-like [Neosynchiropus ocellatus]
MGCLESRHPKLEQASDSVVRARQDFEDKYCQLHPVGMETMASVYAGYKRTNRHPVSIKYVPRVQGVEPSHSLPLEVWVMCRISSLKSAQRSAFVPLLDYYDLGEEVIMILEHQPCSVVLSDFIAGKGGSLREEEVKVLFRQLLAAAKALQSQEIWHSDINKEKILIDFSAKVPKLKLIDFGSCCLGLWNSVHKGFRGTSTHMPPEVFHYDVYQPGPLTVWQMGVTLYEMLHNDKTFDTVNLLNHQLELREGLSCGCVNVLNECLITEPLERPTFKDLESSSWLK